jgi:hypothetical protein
MNGDGGIPGRGLRRNTVRCCNYESRQEYEAMDQSLNQVDLLPVLQWMQPAPFILRVSEQKSGAAGAAHGKHRWNKKTGDRVAS